MSDQSDVIELHAMLYMKNHYKRTDLIADLKVFQAKWCGTDMLFDTDVMWFVTMIYEKYVPKTKQMSLHNMFVDIFKGRSMYPNKAVTMKDVIDHFCSEIRYNVTIKEVTFPEADRSYLPLKDD